MRFVQLTTLRHVGDQVIDSGPCFVNLDRVAYVYRDSFDRHKGTFIQFSERDDDWIMVREPPEQFLPTE